MESDFWQERWQSQQIGFHQAQANPHLLRWWPTLNIATDARILVPLCGKSGDLLWLHQQGHEVIGVELAALACQAFFEENSLPYRTEKNGDYVSWIGLEQAEGIVIVQGDFFTASTALIGPVHGVYDRASLIALPPAMRLLHAAQLRTLLPTGTTGLIVTMAYPADEKAGPPFPVPTPEVRALLETDFTVTLLDTCDLLADASAPNRWGLSALSEAIHAIARR